MYKKKLFRTPVQMVQDMQNELIAIRSQVESIKISKGLSNVHDELKGQFERLFRIASGQYSFEPEISLEEEDRLQKLKDTLVDIEKNHIRYQSENEKLKKAIGKFKENEITKNKFDLFELVE